MNQRPCPFCGESDLSVDFTEDNCSAFVLCETCLTQGPLANEGCRDDDDIDLEAEAIELWNQRKLGLVSLP